MPLFRDVPTLNKLITGRATDLYDLDGDDELNDLLSRVSNYRTELVEEDRHSDMDLHDAHEESLAAGIKLGSLIEVTGEKIYVVVVHTPPSIHTLYIVGEDVKDVTQEIKPALDRADRQIVALKKEQKEREESDD